MLKRYGRALLVGALTLLPVAGIVVPPRPAYAAKPFKPKVGDLVDVEWKNAWWTAKVIKIKEGKYRIHYVGWSSSWDEWVTPARMRPYTGKLKE